jgi:hypothetical protein
MSYTFIVFSSYTGENGGAQRVATTPLMICLAEYDTHQAEMPL